MPVSSTPGARVWRGAELATRWLTPVSGLALSFAGSYVNTVTTKPFTTSDGSGTQPGTQWPLSAKWQSASTLNYARPLYGAWAGGVSAAYTTISSACNTLSYLDTVFGYKTLDLMLSLGNAELPGAAGVLAVPEQCDGRARHHQRREQSAVSAGPQLHPAGP